MERWRPAPSSGNLVGSLGILLTVGAIVGLGFRAIPEAAATPQLQIALWVIVGLLSVLLIALIIGLWGYYSLSYRFEETAGGAVIIRWAWRTVRIPFAEIEYLGPAQPILAATPVRRLWPWPGYYLNTITDPALGKIRLFATLPIQRQVLLCSAAGSFALSPDRPAAFVAQFTSLNTALEAGGPLPSSALNSALRFPTSQPTLLDEDEEDGYPTIAAHGQRAFRERTANRRFALFSDRPAVSLLLLAGALLAAMVWFILLRFNAVPQTLPLHYNVTGQPDRIGTPREIFLFPLIAALVAVANLALAWSVVRFDRFAARLLLGGTCLVQTVAWVALLKIF